MTDEEYLSQLSTIEIYAEILLGILRYTNVKTYNNEQEYKAVLTKKLKFEKQTDFELYRSCIDLLEDTQYAINEVFENGLITKPKHQGEMYLRLYGVLNAYYLQLGAVIDLMKLFNLKNQKEIIRRLKLSKIIETRNKIASHTTSYNVPNSNKEIDFFKLAQSSLNKWGNGILIVGKESYEEVDLIPIMKIFTIEIENILEEIVKKELFSRTFKKESFEWLEFRYNFIKRNKL
ncbi:hypothetical protein ACM55H_13110 [Flavobacterium sp. ZT3R17]|uniref:hypothetical protein n=1 Tax=Flavobacterium cryoconiti TaxID=3398736 RepID=UPI003A88916E